MQTEELDYEPATTTEQEPEKKVFFSGQFSRCIPTIPRILISLNFSLNNLLLLSYHHELCIPISHAFKKFRNSLQDMFFVSFIFNDYLPYLLYYIIYLQDKEPKNVDMEEDEEEDDDDMVKC